jgi:hypothetical protein
MDDESGVTRTVTLRDDWSHLPIQRGDVVNVIGTFDLNQHCLLDNRQENYLILAPNLLLPTTLVGSSYRCARASLLKQKCKVR